MDFLLLKDVRVALIILFVASVCSAFVVAHAAGGAVADWLLKDALNKDMLAESNYAFSTLAEAPVPSDNRYHMQIPMTVEEFTDESLYSTVPDSLLLTLEDGFYDDAYVPYSEEEWETGGNDATEFVLSRPPDPPLE
jgi:hypothetical protein